MGAVRGIGREPAAVEAATGCHRLRVGDGRANSEPGAHAVAGGSDRSGRHAVERAHSLNPRVNVGQRLVRGQASDAREGGLAGSRPALRGGHVRVWSEFRGCSVTVEDVRCQNHIAPVGDALRHLLDPRTQTEGVHVEDDARERARASGWADDGGLGNAFCGGDLDEHLVRISEDDGGRRPVRDARRGDLRSSTAPGSRL